MDRTPMLFVRLAAWVDDDDRDLPRRGYGYRPGMTEQELKEAYLIQMAAWAASLGREPEVVEHLVFEEMSRRKGNQWVGLARCNGAEAV